MLSGICLTELVLLEGFHAYKLFRLEGFWLGPGGGPRPLKAPSCHVNKRQRGLATRDAQCVLAWQSLSAAAPPHLQGMLADLGAAEPGAVVLLHAW